MDLKIAAIGGGTGLSTMLKGLKLHTNKITAIVSVADDGGSSGILRSDMGMLPPGDIRNCVAALTDVEPMYEELLNYRFADGVFNGHTLGNIFLAAINDMSENFDEAVKKFCRLVGVSANVVPVSNDSIVLSALLENGMIVNGESNIGKRTNTEYGIKKVFIDPEDAKPVKSAVRAISDADIIVLGPGSLYTSVIPNLLVSGITDIIRESRAKKIYVCNIMTQPGETDGYSASQHLDALERHSASGIVDYMIVNDAPIPESVKETYALQGAVPVAPDIEKLERRVNVLHGNLFLVKDGQVRHNFSRLSRAIMKLGR
ncbi:MAG: YvcK family protein [Oscillospiraceae bacterium]|nr:YvcK family protein [Oscillospiraceae bacterium]